MQIVLVMFRNDGQRRSFSIHKAVTVIGRREDCDVRIPLGEISRKHCRLVRAEDGTLRVEDAGSSNGTYVNGKRVQQSKLSPGDTLQIGPVAFVLQLDGVPTDAELSPRLRGVSGGAHGGSGGTHPGEDAHTTTGGAEFDPSAVLGSPEDSGAHDVLENSELAQDIAADLERAERSR